MKESRGIKGAWNSLESRKMSLHHNLGYFPFAWCWPFEHHNANSPRHSCKNADRALSATHMLPPSLTDFMMFTVLPPHVPFFPPPPSLSFPPFLPVLPSLSAIFCPASLHAWPALLWLLTSKSYFIHQSLIRKRGPFSAALKEREGTRNECIKKKKKRVCFGGAGDKCMKRGHERERGSALDHGRPWESQKQKKGHAPTHPHTHAESLSALKQTVSHLFSILLCTRHPVADASCTFPSIVFCQSPFSLSVFFFCLLILLIWASGAEGASSPVPSVIPSLHLGCFFSQIFSTWPLATISKSVFSVFSLHWCSLTFSFFFPIPLYFEVAGKLVFRSVGIAIASPLSWSLAHTRLHTNTLAHTDMHTYCSSCSFFSFITGLYGHVVLWPCTHGFLTCKDCL